ncbi:MAG: aminotransferase class I/II-fold pyridoxal phosphate-dependent enzyme, partial [bacterium]
MDLFQKCTEYTKAKEAMAAGIYPYFHALETGQDTEVVMMGHRTLMLGSNNYLGLTSDPRVKKAAMDAVQTFGTGCSGSRFLNGTLTLHMQLEEALAKFLHKEAALTFSTGFQSNLAIISSITGRNDYILSDSMNHASIVDGCRLSFAKVLKFNHSDMQDLERHLANCCDDAHGVLIVTDGVFSMEGEICNLPGIVRLAKKYGARVMVDDAHGLGVLGAAGRGTAEYFGLEKEVDLIMGTFSKTLASLGGYVAASEDVVHFIKHNSRPFIFSASVPPGQVAAALESRASFTGPNAHCGRSVDEHRATLRLARKGERGKLCSMFRRDGAIMSTPQSNENLHRRYIRVRRRARPAGSRRCAPLLQADRPRRARHRTLGP